ncbi:MAG: hypothetical protein ACK5UB_05775 [Pseudanabaena sp.]
MKKIIKLVAPLQDLDSRYHVPLLTSPRQHAELMGEVRSLPKLFEGWPSASRIARESPWVRCAWGKPIRTTTLKPERAFNVIHRDKLTPLYVYDAPRETLVRISTVSTLYTPFKVNNAHSAVRFVRCTCLINMVSYVQSLPDKPSCKTWHDTKHSTNTAFGLLGNKGMHSLYGNIWWPVIQLAVKGTLDLDQCTNPRYTLDILEEIRENLGGEVNAKCFFEAINNIALQEVNTRGADHCLVNTPVFWGEMSKLAFHLHHKWAAKTAIKTGGQCFPNTSLVGKQWDKLKLELKHGLCESLNKDEAWADALAWNLQQILPNRGDATPSLVLKELSKRLGMDLKTMTKHIPEMELFRACQSLLHRAYHMRGIPDTQCNPYLKAQMCIRKSPVINWVTAKVSILAATVQLSYTTENPALNEIKACLWLAHCTPVTNYQWWVRGITSAPLVKHSSVVIGLSRCRNSNKKTGCELGLGPHKPAVRSKVRGKPRKRYGLPRTRTCKKFAVKRRMTTIPRDLPFLIGPHKAPSCFGHKPEKSQNPLWEGGD